VIQPTVHFIEWPRDGEIPTWTIFDPLEDPEAPADPNEEQCVSYVINAVAVDKRGRSSSVDCAQVNIRFGAQREDPIVDPSIIQPIPYDPDPNPPMACMPEDSSTPGDGYYDLPPNTIEATYYYGENDVTVTLYCPYRLSVFKTEGTLTFINNDVKPHHLCSVYTPPYVEFPDLPSLAVGGIDQINFGMVQPGDASSVQIPDGVQNRTTWTFYDLLNPHFTWMCVKVRIVVP
jgi:hypothetical protein